MQVTIHIGVNIRLIPTTGMTLNLYVPKNEKVSEKIEGDADSIVSTLMDILKNKLKVI